MKNFNSLKMFKDDQHIIVFNGGDLTLKVLSLETYNSYIENPDKLQNRERLSSLISPQLNQDVLSSPLEYMSIHEPTQGELPFLDRLTLNVSNACNMACKYCYANAGTYYTHGMQMNRDTALNAVNFAAKNFAAIRHFNFFGGEPTLNPPIIEMVCEYFIYLHNQGILSHLPKFGLTTNCYAMSKEMLQILCKYEFSVSVSLDGPKEIHDHLRVSQRGIGTYDAIVENIGKMIDIGISPEFECTYTAEHYRKGYDLVALMDFFYDTFRSRTLHAPMVISDPGNPWFISLDIATKLYSEAIRYSIFNLIHNTPKSISIATRLLNSMATQTPITYYCPAGKALITINADGNIFACFMLMHGKGFCLGNVNGQAHKYGAPDIISNLLKEANKWQNPDCQNCWARSLCFGCLGEDLSRENSVIHRSSVTGVSKLCDFKRALIEVFLKSVANAQIQTANTVDL